MSDVRVETSRSPDGTPRVAASTVPPPGEGREAAARDRWVRAVSTSLARLVGNPAAKTRVTYSTSGTTVEVALPANASIPVQGIRGIAREFKAHAAIGSGRICIGPQLDKRALAWYWSTPAPRITLALLVCASILTCAFAVREFIRWQFPMNVSV